MTDGGPPMSRQDILDDPLSAFPQLRQFLGAYFHQDWAEDGHRWETVVGDFVDESPGSAVVATEDELRDLLGTRLSDAELSGVVERLGGSVAPSALGTTTTAWLADVLERMGSRGGAVG